MSSTVRPKANRPQPLGILGGTFDPVHNAHLQLADEAMRQLRLSGVLWVPAGRPSHRAIPVAPAADRLAMVRLATAGRPAYEIDEAQIFSVEPSYTVPMLEELRGGRGDACPLVLLMGADAFLGLQTWHRWRELFRLAHLGVVSRPGFPLATDAMDGGLADELRRRRRDDVAALAAAPAGFIVTFTMDAGTVSSTTVRAALREGRGVAELLPAPVVEYIGSHRLYLP